MTTTLSGNLLRRLAELESKDRLRELTRPSGIDFASNDYLGFARHPAMGAAVIAAIARGVPVGSGGSRLLRGNHPEHEALEEEAARCFETESALYFGSGYAANLALFSTLPGRSDAVVYDERVHASVKEGLRASFAARFPARHNDTQAFADAAARARRAGARGLFLAAESVYSMDGDRAPLPELLALAGRLDATLVLDEAHATGVFGPGGRGLSEGLPGERLIRVHTCGKALGAEGALVALPRAARAYLVNAARPLIYSTAPTPLMAAAVRRALRLLDEEPERRERLLRLCALAARLLAEAALPWRVGGDGTQILPLVAGPDARAVALSRALRERGFDVRAARPPTVPEGTARLRISLGAERSEGELRALVAALRELADEDLSTIPSRDGTGDKS